MLIFDLGTIGNKLYTIRKKAGLTQAEVAEIAGLSDRTYADIERGTVNMRIQTLMQICSGLKITPNDILTEQREIMSSAELTKRFDMLSEKDKRVAIQLLSVFIESL